MSAREIISIFYPDSKARLGELIVDAFIKESHTISAEITEHPVEDGSVMADHIIAKPFSLSIDGIISNTPMTLIGLTAFDSAMRFFEGDGNDIVTQSFEIIEDLFAKRTPLSISTSLKTYHNMVLENLTLERGGFYIDSLHFNCTAKQIEIAHQERINLPKPKVNRAKPIEKKGLQETKPLPKEEVEKIKKEKSWLKNIFGDVSLNIGNINYKDMIEISITSQAPHFSQEHQIFGFCYTFEFMWIEREKTWVLHLYDATEKPIALGLKISLDGPIFLDPVSKLVLLLWPKHPQALLTLESLHKDFMLVAYIDETI